MNRSLLLVVEDDPEMRSVVSFTLRNYGYDVREAATGSEALSQIQTRTPDAMLLDLGLPDIDGFVVTACVRQEHEFPIIVLSARGEEQHQVRALDSGANDYVTKPFREGELMARIRAALRRPVPVTERRDLNVGDLRIDSTQRRVFVRGEEVTLTRTEFDLLDVLARNADRVGRRARGRSALPARVHQAASYQNRAEPGAPHSHPHDLGRRLPPRHVRGGAELTLGELVRRAELAQSLG
jgi:two-component system KDP operon response regulator KdpE